MYFCVNREIHFDQLFLGQRFCAAFCAIWLRRLADNLLAREITKVLLLARLPPHCAQDQGRA
jgi:hypothetical protein